MWLQCWSVKTTACVIISLELVMKFPHPGSWSQRVTGSPPSSAPACPGGAVTAVSLLNPSPSGTPPRSSSASGTIATSS